MAVKTSSYAGRMPQMLEAFADELFHENAQSGFYVLAAAVLPVDRHGCCAPVPRA